MLRAMRPLRCLDASAIKNLRQHARVGLQLQHPRYLCTERGTDYDEANIANAYASFRENAFVSRWERTTIANVANELNLSGKSVLDLACGDGNYSRLYRQQVGAARVVGVDLSQDLIELARANERKTPLGGMEYLVSDAANLTSLGLGKFDAVSACWLINYFGDDDELALVLNQVAGVMNPGAAFVGITVPPNVRDYTHGEWDELGARWIRGEAGSGDQVHVDLNSYDPSGAVIGLDVFYRDHAHLERLFKAAGFVGLDWVPIETDDWVDKKLGKTLGKDIKSTMCGIFIAKTSS